MKKNKKILAEQTTDYILNQTTIANQLKALYLEADSSMLQLMRVTQKINSIFLSKGLIGNGNPELGALKEYYTSIKRAVYYFETFISKMITDVTWGSNEGENKAKSFDNWQADANALAKLTLLFIDRAYHDEDQHKALFDFLEKQKGHAQFSEDDFTYYNMKYADDK